MNYIHNTNGDIIQRFKNLRGLRAFASRYGIEHVDINGYVDGSGLMTVFFCGASSSVNFASFEVLQKFVRDWRNARGAKLTVNGLWRGEVTSKEPCNYPAAVEL